jgi:hypothetical protein
VNLKFVYEGTEISHEAADNPELKDHVSFWVVVVSAVLRRQKFYRYVANDKMVNAIAKGIAQITFDNPQLCEWMQGVDWKMTRED